MSQILNVPVATYRIQFNASFGFDAASQILPYLARFGVSHLYFSPILYARPGSAHGYDISNHAELNPELGTREQFDSLMRHMEELGLSFIFDMVPNHMGILGNENVWWNDVLENGPASPYAHYFDIDWSFSLKPELHDKVLLPILGCSYGEALESGQLQLEYVDGRFLVAYFDQHFPVSSCTLESILTHCMALMGPTEPGPGSDEWLEFQSILTAIRNLPRRAAFDLEKTAETTREQEVIRRRFAALFQTSAALEAKLQLTLHNFNGKPGVASSYDLLDALLNVQAYRLSHFRVAADEINYRRFFDINELAALRMERREVYDATHTLLIDLIRSGSVHAVRVDHVDGLYDPKQYLEWLQATYSEHQPNQCRLYLLAEKILCVGEQLPRQWPLSGTTGYEFLADTNWAFVDSSNQGEFNRIYSKWVDEPISYSELAFRSKKQVEYLSLSSDLHMLAKQLDLLSELDRRSRDFTFSAILEALRDIIAYFPVYRTYLDAEGYSDEDRKRILQAMARAKRRNPGVHSSLFEFIQDTLLLAKRENEDETYSTARVEFVRKFQQVTAPVMAKGAEDTAFYRYHRLISLCEVGSDPGVFGETAEEFHRKMKLRSETFPHGLSASSTHDTKRGEDTRARINVLSEIPSEFEALLAEFEATNSLFLTSVEDERIPEPNTRMLLYQTLIGIWPVRREAEDWAKFQGRIDEYMQKAIHESKEFTSWTNPDETYDRLVRDYVGRILDPANETFYLAMDRFIARIAPYGFLNSLSQSLIKLFAPGVPDFYQGSEFWDFHLVDPDNRRPVDFAARLKALETLDGTKGVSENFPRQEAKLQLLSLGLRLRSEQSSLFREGEYTPLETQGRFSNSILAFARHKDKASVVTIASRFLTGIPRLLAGDPLQLAWADTSITLPDKLKLGIFQNVLTGELIELSSNVMLSQVLTTLPFAILSRNT